jgi:hypothetical protein
VHAVPEKSTLVPPSTEKYTEVAFAAEASKVVVPETVALFCGTSTLVDVCGLFTVMLTPTLMASTPTELVATEESV